jgi:hypothetical protein
VTTSQLRKIHRYLRVLELRAKNSGVLQVS